MGLVILKNSMDDDCGCIEQEIECDCGFVSLHFKPDGIAEVYFDNGDSNWEEVFQAASIDDLHNKIQEYVFNLPILDDSVSAND